MLKVNNNENVEDEGAKGPPEGSKSLISNLAAHTAGRRRIQSSEN